MDRHLSGKNKNENTELCRKREWSVVCCLLLFVPWAWRAHPWLTPAGSGACPVCDIWSGMVIDVMLCILISIFPLLFTYQSIVRVKSTLYTAAIQDHTGVCPTAYTRWGNMSSTTTRSGQWCRELIQEMNISLILFPSCYYSPYSILLIL